MNDLISREQAMAFPNTWKEFEEEYGFTDEDRIYTNGSRLIPSFRVEQWLEHIARPKGKWLWIDGVRCSRCNYKLQTTGLPSYCPNCGSLMGRK